MPSPRAHVCIVDDDDGVRYSTLALLRAAGIPAHAFASGGDFLQKLDSSDCGCILLDLHMPGLSGFQVLDILQESGNACPVVLFSGRVDPTTEQFAKRSGAAALLPKPVAHAELIALVRRLLEKGDAA